MIDPLDSMLRDLIQSRIPKLAGPTQVGFAPPNADWKAAVVAAGEERVNLYLYDLRENVPLRTNERKRTIQDGGFLDNLPSPRLDCTYLVTAWSPVAVTPLLEPSRDEHDLLYRVLKVLMASRPLEAVDVYSRPNPLGHTIASVPLELRDPPLPLNVALPDAVKEPTEFWTTMKVDSKPALHLSVTVPVVLDEPDFESPMVTTLTGAYSQAGVALATETVVSVGGRVLQGLNATPVGGAAVEVVGLDPPEIADIRQRAVTGSDGTFVLSGLRAGRYELRAVAGTAEKKLSVEVPSPSGRYDVRLP